MRRRVDFQVGHGQAGVLGLVLPPQQCPDAGQKLLEPERLGQIIVRPRVRAPDDVLRGVAGRQNQDVRRRALGPELLQERPAVDLREHQVEEDDVVIVGLGQEKPFLAVLGRVDGERLLLPALFSGS